MAETRQTRTVYEAAERMGCHPLTVRRLIRDGKLRAVRIGRKVVVPVSALDEFLERQPA
jgi:excisionase family DNA binding protein